MADSVPRLTLLLAVVLFSARAATPLETGTGTGEPPSILLIVIDTLRADAVSAYGDVDGTTPELDALARDGLLYRRAYASAPWTVPSHATLLSGLPVDEHRVGMPGRILLPEDIVTLAERFAAAGYETVGISENQSVSDAFGMLQGFELRSTTRFGDGGRAIEIDAESEVLRWLDQRKPERPFFAFVNLFEPHQPYELRDHNDFVPDDASPSLVAARSPRPNKLTCGAVPGPDRLAIQHGLYLGDVHAADAELGRIVRAIRARGGASRLLVVATSDHGEYFGEHRLMGHLYGLDDAVLRVPLIVQGLEDAAPGVIEQTVRLVDVAPSLLAWAGIAGSEALPGQPLPRGRRLRPPEPRPVFAAYSDAGPWVPQRWRDEARKALPIGAGNVDLFDIDANRDFCTPADRVWGGMATWIEYPYKLRWFEKYPPALYDLSWDPEERSDQAELHPEIVERLVRRLEPRLRAAGLVEGSRRAAEPVPEEATRALHELGYIE